MRAESEMRISTTPQRDVEIVRGEGCLLFGADGRTYLDFGVSHGACNLGHTHPAVVRALQDQARRLLFVGSGVRNDARRGFLAALSEIVPAPLSRTFLSNSGAEAVEAALKFARSATGRPGLVAALRSFHGRTFGALSVTWRKEFREPFEPLLPGVDFVPFNDAEALAGAVGKDTAAVILEPVQGEGGVYVGDPEYLRAARDLCTDRGALLILDEVQTGLGRTGRTFDLERAGTVPDVLVLGKSLAGGFPIGATVVTDDVHGRLRGSHHSTFGGGPLACAAGVAALQVLRESDLAGRAADLSVTFLRRLRGLDSPGVREVRGISLMAAVELRGKAAPVLEGLMDRGILAIPSGTATVRFLPPLVVTPEELDAAVLALEGVLAGG